MKRWVVSLTLAALLVGCGGGGGHTIHGTLTAPGCDGGWNITNANVEVRDQDNKLIGSGTTGLDLNHHDKFDPALDQPGCRVSFVIPDVSSAKFYSFKIGAHDGPSYSQSQLEQQDWHVSLSLGD